MHVDTQSRLHQLEAECRDLRYQRDLFAAVARLTHLSCSCSPGVDCLRCRAERELREMDAEAGFCVVA